MESQKSITVCLADWGAVLPDLCELINSPFSIESFEKIELDFINSKKEELNFTCLGENNSKIVVKFEIYEGYYFGTFTSGQETNHRARKILFDIYVSQGGDPENFD